MYTGHDLINIIYELCGSTFHKSCFKSDFPVCCIMQHMSITMIQRGEY